MDLAAGDARIIARAIAEGDLAALEDRTKVPAHLALGSGLDPTWLDLFAEAARNVVGFDGPGSFLDARIDLDTGSRDEAHSVERVDPAWITAVARIPERRMNAVAAGWIELVEEEFGPLEREEKPWIRELAARLVAFCRSADAQPDVLFAWSLR